MKHTMNRKVMITCALTGAGDTVGRSEHVPVTPEQIAESGIAAARAGATIVHVHVRDPETGKGSREVEFYREAVERIRAADVDVIVNTTAGMGGDLMLDPQNPTDFVEGTDLVSGVERLKHVEAILPEICTLDCGSLNFGEGSLVYVSTPDMLRDGAKKIQELGVRVEMEIFDTGHLWFARQLVDDVFFFFVVYWLNSHILRAQDNHLEGHLHGRGHRPGGARYARRPLPVADWHVRRAAHRRSRPDRRRTRKGDGIDLGPGGRRDPGPAVQRWVPAHRAARRRRLHPDCGPGKWRQDPIAQPARARHSGARSNRSSCSQPDSSRLRLRPP